MENRESRSAWSEQEVLLWRQRVWYGWYTFLEFLILAVVKIIVKETKIYADHQKEHL